jgi:hypothetical protein
VDFDTSAKCRNRRLCGAGVANLPKILGDVRYEKEMSWTMARPPHERSRGMSDITLDQTENAPLNTEISDEVLEGAAWAGHAGAYTQFAYCTSIGCPGSPRLDPAPREIR